MFELDLQLFAEEESGATGEAAAPQTETESTETETTGGETGTGETQTGEAVVAEQPAEKTKQTPEQDAAFAKLRREADESKALKAELARRDAWVTENYGHLNIHTWDQYQLAIAEQNQRKAEESVKQREASLREAGYDDTFIDLVKKIDQLEGKLRQSEMSDQQRRKAESLLQAEKAVKADYEYLKNRYGDLVPDYEDLDNDKEITALVKRGYSVKAAWLELNEDKISAHALDKGEKKAIRDINSKAHLGTEKSGAGKFEAPIEVSPEKVDVYKKMFPGITMADIRKRESKYLKK